ncbi:thioredoxin family protein [Oceanidesulfovibrio marinus]|uniref:Thioredoxin n=1 Tax=Oceanidesulfovibrio marinus TaxID=370038 RepID=A0A6P1ZKG0_9BACT|nr:thioredoxin family protein [Oceanidesulfovibrio marinus]QJT09821.1 thioredoxin family protein [Oceanidesulfovibrio marinus]TVM36062.1 thioredoxin [Oceanidesulfovibrio marinus]
MIKEVNTQEYDALDKSGVMLVEFYSKTCGPCKMLAFVLKDIDKNMSDFPIYTVDFDENQELKERCGVKGFPTMLFMKDGEEVSRLEGLKQKPAIIKEIEKLNA